MMAAASPVKINPNELWTGKWKVEGNTWFAGTWVLKQSGKVVKSTKASYYGLEGKIKGRQLIGKGKDDYGFNYKVVLDISSDGQSFEGTWVTDFQGRSSRIFGKRVE